MNGLSNLPALRVFRRVVEAGSFSRAAEDLRMTSGYASKLVTQLEDELGSRLLERSTRSLRLTEPGRLFYERIASVLDALDAAVDSVDELRDGVRGLLRVAVAHSFGLAWLSPRVPRFLERYPELRLELMANNRQVDLLGEGLDCALRVASELPDSSLVARTLGPVEHVVVASPDYLGRRGGPEHPDALAAHECLGYSLSPQRGTWPFVIDGQPVRVAVGPRYWADDSVMLRDAAVAGLGVAMMPRFVVEAQLRSGALVPLLERFVASTHRVHGVTLQGRHVPAKVRALFEFVARELEAPA